MVDLCFACGFWEMLDECIEDRRRDCLNRGGVLYRSLRQNFAEWITFPAFDFGAMASERNMPFCLCLCEHAEGEDRPGFGKQVKAVGG